MWFGQRHRKPGTCRQHRSASTGHRHPDRHRASSPRSRHGRLEGRLRFRRTPAPPCSTPRTAPAPAARPSSTASAQFAGSDAYLKDEELASPKAKCGPDGAINIPVYISPIAVAFNLPGVTDLKLDADTIAKIFRGQITKWNDPAIAALNPGVELPDPKVTPVQPLRRLRHHRQLHRVPGRRRRRCLDRQGLRRLARHPAGRERQGHLRRRQDRHRHPGRRDLRRRLRQSAASSAPLDQGRRGIRHRFPPTPPPRLSKPAKPVEGRSANDLSPQAGPQHHRSRRLPDRAGFLPHRLHHLRMTGNR